MSMSNMGTCREFQSRCRTSNPKLKFEQIMKPGGAGDGTRTRDTLLGRNMALNRVAYTQTRQAKVAQLSSGKSMDVFRTTAYPKQFSTKITPVSQV